MGTAVTSTKLSASARRVPRHTAESVEVELPPDERGVCERRTFSVRPLTAGQFAEARKQSTSAEGQLDEYGFYVRVVHLGCPEVAEAAGRAPNPVAWVDERFRYLWGVLLRLADAIIRCSGQRPPSRRPGRTFAVPTYVAAFREAAATPQPCVRHAARVRRGTTRRPGVRRVSRRSSARGSPDDLGDGEPSSTAASPSVRRQTHTTGSWTRRNAGRLGCSCASPTRAGGAP